MNQQEMHDEQIKDKLRMKDDALRAAIDALKIAQSETNTFMYVGYENVIKTATIALEA